MKKIWRFSHLSLALISFLFLVIASITGAILAIEPVQDHLNQEVESYPLQNFQLYEIISLLKENYDEVYDLKINQHHQIMVNVLNFDPELEGEYILNPISGDLVPIRSHQRSKIYEWSQTLHRSLFLETTGRNIMALMAFLLMLITLSGIALIMQRQQGWQKFYHKIVSSHFSQFSHIWLGRIFLFPLIIVTLTALILSIDRWGWAEPKNPIQSQTPYQDSESIQIKAFDILQGKTLADVTQIDFPFTQEADDYYRIYFKDEIVDIAQSNGQVLSRESIATIQQLKPWAKLLHTGQGGSWLWAMVLLFSAISVLYFIISGSVIFWKRNFKSKIKNNFTHKDAEYIILYGSENGSTQHKALALYLTLIKNNQKAYIEDLNHIKDYPAIKQLVIITSTYADGEAPSNANKFLSLVPIYFTRREFKYSIVGFGAKEFPKFCQFAKDCNMAMSKTSATMLVKSVYINHQDIQVFKNWCTIWAQKNKLSLDFTASFNIKQATQHSFKIIDKLEVYDGYQTTFNLWIKPEDNLSFESGDLLAVFAPNAQEERFYSLSKLNDLILISVKLHDQGLCSNYLYQTEVGTTIQAYIKQQTNFHYNPQATSHTYIANGTGIAPLIGMLKNHPDKKQYVILGLRNKKSFELYQALFHDLHNTQLQICYSRESEEPKYLQEAVNEQKEIMMNQLKQGGEVLICGNLSIAKDVWAILDQTFNQNNLSLEEFKDRLQIKMDCY